jgi:hypothetical protein
MPRRFLIALVTALALGAPVAAQASTPLYPNLKTLPPRNLRFDRTDITADSSGILHNVLRFSNTTYNVGEGPLEIRATINQSLNPPSGPAFQRIYDTSGGFTDVPLTGSTLYYHAVHKHYHFDNWGAYELWTKSAYDAWILSGRTSGSPDLVGQKTTSCVEDEEFVASVTAAIWPEAYPPATCLPNANNVIAEGLSPGWGDTYDYYRFQQWIDLGATGTLADGTYVLRSVADPLNLVYESTSKSDTTRESQSDNEATTTFTVSGGQIIDTVAPTGTVTINHVDKLTTSAQVSLAILGRDDLDGVDQFRVSNDGSSWATYTNSSSDSIPQTIPWDLTDAAHGGTAQSGVRTVSVQFHDTAGHWGPIATDTIDYEPPPPVVSAYGKAVQADGPVGWWRLGDASGTTAVDQTGADAGTYAGGVTLGQPSLVATDAANKAVAFNGSTGVVTIPAATALNFTSAFSLEAWIKPTSLPATGAFRSVLTKAEAYSLQFNGPRLEFTVIQSGTRRRLQGPSGAVVAGSTYHVVATFDGTTQRLYLNGVQVASAALSGAASVSTNALRVGSWDGASEFFTGTIDDPAVYGKVLSAAQVAAHYSAGTTATLTAPSGLAAAAGSSTQINLTWTDNASGETSEVVERSADSSFSTVTAVTVPAGSQSYADTGLSPSTTYWYRVKAVSGATSSAYSNAAQATTQAPPSYAATVLVDHPVSYWRLDETSGTIAGDETVANPGTFVGSPTLGVPSLLFNDPADGGVGFNGTTADVRIGQAGVLDFTNAMTLEAWVKPTTLPGAGVSRSIVAKPGSYALQLVGPTAAFTVVQFGVRRVLQAPAGTILAGNAYHLVGTFDGATQRLYVNGVQVATAALTGSADLTLGGIHIGSWDGASEFFAGTIDDVSIASKVLSAAQVSTHYAAAKAPLGAPSDLAATAASSSQIAVQWTDNATTETGMLLQRSTSSSFSSPTSIPLPANAQSYSDTGLAAGTTYWYRVQAAAGASSSAWSAPVSTATLPPVPYATVIAADAPVSWWRLGEASGTVAADQRAANPGTYLTGTTLGAASLLPTAPSDHAVGFDGVKGAVRVAASSSLNVTSTLSLEAWIKPTSLPAAGAFASVLTKAEAYSLQFNGPRMEFTVIQSGTRRRLQAPAGAVVAGSTYHVVGTFDGTTQRLYLNGVQVASVALSGAASVSTNPVYVGSWDGASEFFKGTIDEPAIYPATLSAAAVAHHYAAGTTG